MKAGVIRSRLTLRLILTLGVSLLLIFGAITLLLIEESRGDLRREIEKQGTLVLRLLQGPPALIPPGEVFKATTGDATARESIEIRLERLLDLLGPDSAVAGIALDAVDGRPIARVVRSPRLPGQDPWTGTSPDVLVVRGDYEATGDRRAAIGVLLPLDNLNRLVIATRNKAIRLVIIEALLVTIMLFALLTSRVLRPIRQLVQATERIREGDLSYRVPVTSTDELGQLAESFNRMLEQLAAYRQAQEARARDLEEAYDQLKRTQDRLIASEKLSSVGHLAAGIAHEIGNPLSAILGFTEVLLMDADDDQSRSFLEQIRREIHRIEKIVRRVLDFSRPTALTLSSVDLHQVIDRTLELARHDRAFRHVQPHIDLAPDLPQLLGSADHLQQVFLNLFLNAARSMEGQGRLTVRAAPSPGEAMVQIEVSDEGCGIPKEHLNQIFDPFFTTSNPGEGTGLGLSICHTIVLRHKGTIEVESLLGAGTTFRIRLPTVDATPSPATSLDREAVT